MISYKIFNIKALVLAFGLIANVAHASLLVEPHLGFNISGSGDNGKTGSAKEEYDYSGAQYGLRVGYQNLGFMAGMDFTRSSYDQDYTTSGVTTVGEIGRNEWGIFAGYNLPILLRAWAAYYFSNTAKDSKLNNEMSGSTTELGVGFTGLPFLSLNLMYRMVSYDDYTNSAGAESSIDVTNHEFVLGVSIPLTL